MSMGFLRVDKRVRDFFWGVRNGSDVVLESERKVTIELIVPEVFLVDRIS